MRCLQFLLLLLCSVFVAAELTIDGSNVLISSSYSVTSFRLVDLDHNGELDFVVQTETGDILAMMHHGGQIQNVYTIYDFAESGDSAAPAYDVGDFDGDGDFDVCISLRGDVWLLLNINGLDNPFRREPIGETGHRTDTIKITAVDMDDDGMLDLTIMMARHGLYKAQQAVTDSPTTFNFTFSLFDAHATDALYSDLALDGTLDSIFHETGDPFFYHGKLLEESVVQFTTTRNITHMVTAFSAFGLSQVRGLGIFPLLCLFLSSSSYFILSCILLLLNRRNVVSRFLRRVFLFLFSPTVILTCILQPFISR